MQLSNIQYSIVLIKEIKDANKWKDISCSWIKKIGKNNIIKIAILSKKLMIQCSPYQDINDTFQEKN